MLEQGRQHTILEWREREEGEERERENAGCKLAGGLDTRIKKLYEKDKLMRLCINSEEQNIMSMG